MEDPRRSIPGVDVLLQTEEIRRFEDRISVDFITAVIRDVLSEVRDSIEKRGEVSSQSAIIKQVVLRLQRLLEPSLKRCINATGIVLHTGLGRAPLCETAKEALADAAGYVTLEINTATGQRGERQDHLEYILCKLTGAQSALVVNNNAAAVYLTLNTIGFRKEIVVSRGQLIEIGGSFRLPQIMVRSGVRLVEVGATNRTRIEDYRQAITNRTAALLRAYPSNYRIHGFTESASIEDLVALGREYSIPVIDDLGGGLLWNWKSQGLPEEPSVEDSIAAGVDLVMVSGDKVLGGSQAGIILGQRDLIRRLHKCPLARVVRPDKLILAALGATLRSHLNKKHFTEEIPARHMLSSGEALLMERAKRLLEKFKSLGNWQVLDIRETTAEAGSGTLPDVPLPSIALVTLPKGWKSTAWARALRSASVPVFGTVQNDLLWLNMRTVSDSEENDLTASVAETLTKK